MEWHNIVEFTNIYRKSTRLLVEHEDVDKNPEFETKVSSTYGEYTAGSIKRILNFVKFMGMILKNIKFTESANRFTNERWRRFHRPW